MAESRIDFCRQGLLRALPKSAPFPYAPRRLPAELVCRNCRFGCSHQPRLPADIPPQPGGYRRRRGRGRFRPAPARAGLGGLAGPDSPRSTRLKGLGLGGWCFAYPGRIVRRVPAYSPAGQSFVCGWSYRERRFAGPNPPD